MIDRKVLCRMLEIDVNAPNRVVVGTSLRHRKLVPVALSIVRSDGASFGPASSAWLERNSVRADDYLSLHHAMKEIANVHILKGSGVSSLYPPSIMRHVGDLDLVVDHEPELWACAKRILERRPVTGVTFTMVSDDPRHLAVSLHWDSSEPLLDEEMRVEIGTAPFLGNQTSVPIRAAVPKDLWLRNFLAISEERFQQEFRIKDLIDIGAMAPLAPEAEYVLDAVNQYNLAPEAEELLTETGRYIDLCELERVRRGMKDLAREERLRRDAWHPPTSDVTSVRGRIESGLPVYGLAMEGVQVREAQSRFELCEYPGGYFALTPIGDFLLVPGKYVDRTTYDDASIAWAKLRSN